MWCIEAKAKVDIPLGSEENNYHTWGNARLVQFIISHRTNCSEFREALIWLGDRDYEQAIKDCKNRTWISWLHNKLSDKKFELIKEGETITVTHGRNEKFALWASSGIWDLPEGYVGETIRVVCPS